MKQVVVGQFDTSASRNWRAIEVSQINCLDGCIRINNLNSLAKKPMPRSRHEKEMVDARINRLAGEVSRPVIISLKF